MFFSDAIIDSIQNAKKNVVNSVVTHEGIKESMLKFVDKQTAYTKETVSNLSSLSSSISLQLFGETNKAVAEFMKFDWVKPIAKKDK